MTGKGHLSDQIIIRTLAPRPVEVCFHMNEMKKHPNTLELHAFDAEGGLLETMTVYSVGGGVIEIEGEDAAVHAPCYPHHTLDEIKAFCTAEHIGLNAYVDQLTTMHQQLSQRDPDPDAEDGRRRAQRQRHPAWQAEAGADRPLPAAGSSDVHGSEPEKLLLCAYAYAACEENASGGMSVTAPTLGSSGLLPALLYYYYYDLKYQRETLVEGLKVAGLIGNLIKHNATISGAQGGCQAEIGAACAMGAAMIAYLMGLDMDQIEYAAEMGIEHHLGLTCDPVGGYVMIPCIERNAVCALRAIDAAILARHLRRVHRNRVSFDMVVETMNKTGIKLPIELKESAFGRPGQRREARLILIILIHCLQDDAKLFKNCKKHRSAWPMFFDACAS